MAFPVSRNIASRGLLERCEDSLFTIGLMVKEGRASGDFGVVVLALCKEPRLQPTHLGNDGGYQPYLTGRKRVG